MEYTQPVKVGDEIKVDIENIGERGDGIARYNNFVIMVPSGQVEKSYFIKVKKVFKSWALSEIIKEVN